ncbi:hypothetical protein NUSPORA_01210 [Nucleospora cyclopteri]
MKELKSAIKIFYYLIQAIIFLSGTTILIFSWIIYINSYEFLHITPIVMIPICFMSIISIINSLFGCAVMLKFSKTKLFLFILSLTALLNFQLIQVFRANQIVDNFKVWTRTKWMILTEDQKNFLQQKLDCCGFETINEESGSICNSKVPCLKIFKKMSYSLRSNIQKLISFMFLLETIGLCIFSLIKRY